MISGKPPRAAFKEFIDKGFKKQAAAIKTVFSDQRVHCVVSEMTTRDSAVKTSRPVATTRSPFAIKSSWRSTGKRPLISIARAAATIASQPLGASPSRTLCATALS